MVTASYGHCGQCAARIGPDRVGRIRLPASFSVPFFQRRHGTYCAKPTRIRYRWPGQGLATLIWSESKPVCRFQAGRNRPATSFPLLKSVPFFHRRPDNIVRNQPGSDLLLADCARFWPNGSGPEESQCARIIRPASGQCFPADLARLRIGSGMFTG